MDKEKILDELKKRERPEEKAAEKHEPPERKHIKKHTGLIVFMLIFLIIAGGGIYAYLTIISPVNVEKPEISDPGKFSTDSANTTVEEQHVQYVANEIGAYKLHDDPRTKENAVIEFVLTDTGTVFTVEVENNYPIVTQGKAADPDLRITTTQNGMRQLLSAGDINAKVVELAKTGVISVELIADEATLALKGYKAVYDSLQ